MMHFGKYALKLFIETYLKPLQKISLVVAYWKEIEKNIENMSLENFILILEFHISQQV
jgi:hypothetical protein